MWCYDISNEQRKNIEFPSAPIILCHSQMSFICQSKEMQYTQTEKNAFFSNGFVLMKHPLIQQYFSIVDIQ